jgi:hypothetical protein
MASHRTYEPHEKHKWPKGYGSLCQRCISLEHAEELLQSAVAESTDREPKKLYAVCGEAVFVARSHGQGWHGYPVAGSEVPPSVIRDFQEQGLIDGRVAKRLYRQRQIPEHCGCN